MIPTQELRDTVLDWCHNSSLTCHPGISKTHQLCSRHFWWEGLSNDVRQFISTCSTCTRNKDSHSSPSGLLQLMPIPPSPWHSISLDFITQLPKSQGKDTILVVVDSFSKMGHFIALKGLPTAKGLATIFIDHIVRLHGLPSEVISDRGPQFIAKFWRELCSILDIKVHLSSAYHPQTDGQTERLNQTLEQNLRCLFSTLSSDWVSCLSIAEFAYNNLEHSSTGFSPFFCLTGRNPRCLPIDFDSLKATSVPAVTDHVHDLISIHQKVIENLTKTKDRKSVV